VIVTSRKRRLSAVCALAIAGGAMFSPGTAAAAARWVPLAPPTIRSGFTVRDTKRHR